MILVHKPAYGNLALFNNAQRIQLIQASKALDPSGMVLALIHGEFGKSLTSEQEDYLSGVKQLAEQSMAMRSVIGAGQSSEMLRTAILATIPSETSFSKSYAQKQLTQFKGTLSRLKRGIPKMALRDVEDPSEKKETKSGEYEETKTIGNQKYGKKGGKWYAD